MRYQVREGSQSCHCCFGWTVIDTYSPTQYTESKYEAMCECFEKSEAEQITYALNKDFGGEQ